MKNYKKILISNFLNFLISQIISSKLLLSRKFIFIVNTRNDFPQKIFYSDILKKPENLFNIFSYLFNMFQKL